MKNFSLHKYFLNNSGKSIFKWIHYFNIYEKHLCKFVGKSPVVLEIGVAGGGSLSMWKDYFGEESKIIGIDIDKKCKNYEEKNIEIFIGSQDDFNLIDKIFSKYKKIDIVIDDGSHNMHHMIRSFELMYDRIDSNGVYIVEDAHTCYWEEYGGGLKRENSFMEFAKNKIDEINAAHSRGSMPINDFTRSTDCISFYDSVIVFERRKQGHKQTLATQQFFSKNLSLNNPPYYEQFVKKLELEDGSNDWITLFRSSDPTVWDTDTFEDGSFAIKLDKAPNEIKYLRVMSVYGQPIIIPMSKSALGVDGMISENYGWAGANRFLYFAFHLGVYDARSWSGAAGDVHIIPEGGHMGWGFGNAIHLNDGQHFTWDMKSIPRSIFEISVKCYDLTDEEKLQIKV